LRLNNRGKRSLSSAKNFGKVGALFAGTECVIETYRGRNDMYNGIGAGAISGAVLAAKSGPQGLSVYFY
jgi:import inner membrane translocase subunit TIM22